MLSRANGHASQKQKQKQPKFKEVKSLKRKREQDDLQTLQTSVDDFVCHVELFSSFPHSDRKSRS